MADPKKPWELFSGPQASATSATPVATPPWLMYAGSKPAAPVQPTSLPGGAANAELARQGLGPAAQPTHSGIKIGFEGTAPTGYGASPEMQNYQRFTTAARATAAGAAQGVTDLAAKYSFSPEFPQLSPPPPPSEMAQDIKSIPHGISEGIVSPIRRAVVDKDIPGAMGEGAVSVPLSAQAIEGGVSGIRSAGTLAKDFVKHVSDATAEQRLAYASGTAGKKIDTFATVQKVLPDVERQVKAMNIAPDNLTVSDYANAVRRAGTALQNEYAVAMFPTRNSQTVATPIADAIRAEADKMVPKIATERATQAYLRNRAVEFDQPYTLAELDRARMNANARLEAFEGKGDVSQMNQLRRSEDTMVDKAIADGARDIVYQQMEKFHGKPDYFRELKQRQSAMLDLQRQLQDHIVELSNQTARQKGAPLLSSENFSTYGNPAHGRIGFSIHSLQKATPGEFFTPLGAANRAVRSAFYDLDPAVKAQAQAQVLQTPLRLLLASPSGQSQSQPPPPPQ